MSVPVVAVEILTPTGWVTPITLSDVEPHGSLSSHEPNGKRRIIIFGWDGDTPGVWESRFGFDLERGIAREIISAEKTQLSDLAEPFEMTIYTQGGVPRHMRFRLSSTDMIGGSVTPLNPRREAPGD